MTYKNHFLFWLLAFAVFIGFVALFKAILLPFVLGIAIAYFLDPTVEKLAKFKINRGLAAIIILATFFTVVLGFFAALVPLLIKELSGLANDLPELIEKTMVYLDPYLERIRTWVGAQNQEDLQNLITQHAKSAAGMAGNFAKSLADGGLAVFDFLSLVVVTPVMAYYMMKEWPHIIGTVEDLLPRKNRETIMDIFDEISKKLSAFIRGQISIAIILAFGYGIILSLIGLKFGFLIGFTAGLLSVIPFLGSILGFVTAMIVAWFQGGDTTLLALVAGTFVAGQIIEGYFLTPKLVGDSVGLHPLWIFFALMAGGSLFGIVGMLIAVPVAAVASVLINFALLQYKKSPYYQKKQIAKKKTNGKTGAAKKS